MNFSKISLTVLGMGFIFLSNHALDQDRAKRVLYWLDTEATCDFGEPSAITFDGRYKNRDETYEAIANMAREKDAEIKEYSFDEPGIEIMKKIYGGGSNFKGDKNIEVIDVSYDRLKNYYDNKHKRTNVTFKFSKYEDQNEAKSFLKQLKDFFDAGGLDSNKFEELAKKFFVVCQSKDTPKGYSKIMNNVIDVMIKSEVGSKRVKSLFLQILLSRIEEEELYKTDDPLPIIDKIVFEEDLFGDVSWGQYADPLQLKDLINNFCISNVDKNINLKNLFLILEKALYPNKINPNSKKIKRSNSESIERNLMDLSKAYEFIAVALIHELSHTYHNQLPLPFSMYSKNAFCNFREACFKNNTLAGHVIPLLNPALSNKVKEIAKEDPKIQMFLKNNTDWVEKHLKAIAGKINKRIDALDMLIDRDIAREFNVLDGLEETMTISGSFFFHLGNDKFVWLKDMESEAAASKEFGFPVRYGHANMRLNDKKTNEVYKSDNCELNYEPFRLIPSVINQQERMFEPIILKDVINKAAKELYGWKNLKRANSTPIYQKDESVSSK